MELDNIAGAELSVFTRLTNRLGLLLAALQVFSIIVLWLDSQATGQGRGEGYPTHYSLLKPFIKLHMYICNLKHLFRAVHQWISTGLSLGR